MSRPTKYTSERADIILAALRDGNTRRASAGVAGVDDHTLLRWLARYGHFAEAVRNAEAEAEIRAVAAIRKAADDGTWTASAWWLERRRYRDYGRIDRVEVTIRETAQRIAAQTGADPEWLVARAEEIAREAQASKT